MKYIFLILTVLFSNTALSQPRIYTADAPGAEPVPNMVSARAHRAKRATFTLYSYDRIKMTGWKTIDKEAGIFTLNQQMPETAYPHLLIANLITVSLHDRFSYLSDGVSDTWESKYEDYKNGYFEGDCDDFSMTAAVALAHSGIPTENIYLALVQNRSRDYIAPYLPNAHPESDQPNHMVLMLWANGGWYVVDNRFTGVSMAEDVYRERYEPVAIINVSNYGKYTQKDTTQGWARFWFRNQ